MNKHKHLSIFLFLFNLSIATADPLSLGITSLTGELIDLTEEVKPKGEIVKSKDLKAYVIGLLDRVYPYETAIKYPSLKDKKKLDQIVEYINNNNNENSRFLIDVFVSALFHKKSHIRTNSAVFLSKMNLNPSAELTVLKKVRSVLNIPENSSAQVFNSSQENSALVDSERELIRLKQARAILDVSEENILPENWDLVVSENNFPKLKRTPGGPLISQAVSAVTTFFKKPKPVKYSDQVMLALEALADISPPMGQKDFELQKALFDIMLETFERFKRLDKLKKWHLFCLYAVRALLSINPHYPDFDIFLTKSILRMDRFDLLFDVFLTALIKIQPVDEWIHHKLGYISHFRSKYFEENYYKRYPYSNGVTTYSLPNMGTDNVERIHIFLKDMEKKLISQSGTQIPVRDSTIFEESYHKDLKPVEDKGLILIDSSAQIHIDRISYHRLNPFIRDNGEKGYFPSISSEYPTRDINTLKYLSKTAPSSEEFLRFLIKSLTSSDIYIRDIATNIVEEISINESALEIFFLDPTNDPHIKDSEHRRLAMRLWIAVDPGNQRLKKMLESAVSDPNFENIENIKDEARDYLERGIITTSHVNTDEDGKKISRCQGSFRGVRDWQ